MTQLKWVGSIGRLGNMMGSNPHVMSAQAKSCNVTIFSATNCLKGWKRALKPLGVFWAGETVIQRTTGLGNQEFLTV